MTKVRSTTAPVAPSPKRLYACLVALGLLSSTAVWADATPQSLPFAQNWSNLSLITANDSWAGVPGIVGYLGDYSASSPTGVDPQTILGDIGAIDVIANQAGRAR